MSNQRNKELARRAKSTIVNLELNLEQANALNNYLSGFGKDSKRQAGLVKHIQVILNSSVSPLNKDLYGKPSLEKRNGTKFHNSSKATMNTLFDISHGKWPQRKGNYSERIEWLKAALAQAQEECSFSDTELKKKIGDVSVYLESLLPRYPERPNAVVDAVRTHVRNIIRHEIQRDK